MLATKNLLSITLFSLVTCGLSAYSDEEVQLDVKNIHVPKGWDSNDKDVQVIVTGELPNTCYRRPYGEAKVVDNQVVIDMKATKVDKKDTVCIMAVVPYMVSVELGQLNEGSYEVEINPHSSNKKISSLSIDTPSSNSIDNYSYANVTNLKRKGHSDKFTLEGVHPSSCMSIERVEVISNQSDDTFSVLPIVKQVAPVCDRMIMPFTYDFELPAKDKEEIVVHVRKIDGNAANYSFKNNTK
ncbi:MAG: hypothetical protein H6731_05260 [Myxococcales bacterium]|nr:MAG: hypothetical protein H6731_05260 [Myxococcales bacterium]